MLSRQASRLLLDHAAGLGWRRGGQPQPLRTFSVAAAAFGSLRTIRDDNLLHPSDTPEGVFALRAAEEPVILHCGASWSKRSNAVAERLAEWSRSTSGVVCATADLASAPRFVEARSIRSMPTVLLLRGGKVEQRLNGAGIDELEGMLATAGSYAALVDQDAPSSSEADSAPEEEALTCSANAALVLGDEALRRGQEPGKAARYFEHALQTGEVQHPSFVAVRESSEGRARPTKAIHPTALRARLGLLRCAVAAAEQADWPPPPEKVAEAQKALESLQLHHRLELQGTFLLEDAGVVAQFVAHAELMVDAWVADATKQPGGDEAEVLHLYSQGQFDAALAAGLQWYKLAATSDMQGLVTSYCLPERLVPDRPAGIVGLSIYADEPLKRDLDEAPGPARARAMLRRLFEAIGVTDESVFKARAELELLIDKKPHVRFHTRRVELRHLLKPQRGRGTGKRSGYSKRYWLTYGPGTKYKNQKKMGGPHTDKND